jgi:hypothetical protein
MIDKSIDDMEKDTEFLKEGKNNDQGNMYSLSYNN